MPDPIGSQVQFISQQAKATGLASLMKGGSLTGTVLSQQSGGKTIITFQGQNFQFMLKDLNLSSGQKVEARWSGGKIVLESYQPPSEGKQTENPGRNLATILANWGLKGSSSHTLAQALIGAGVPLNQDVLKELAALLPQMTPDQMSALTFLFSRGLPINPAIVSLISQLFSKRIKQDETLSKVISSLDDLDKEDDEPVIPSSRRRQLRDIRQQIEQFVLPLKQRNDEDFEEQLGEFFRNAMASPESLMQNQDSPTAKALGDAILRLLLLLMDIKPFMEGTRQEALFQTLLTAAQELHEHLSGRALQNMPPQTHDSNHPVYFQIPFNGDHGIQDLEVKFRPRGNNKRSGDLDLKLELTNLGPLLVSIHWNHPQIAVNIKVTQAPVSDFIEQAMDELRTVLQEKGFEPTTLGVTVGDVPESIRPINANTMTTSRSGFDMRV